MSEVKEFKTTQSLELSRPGKDWRTYYMQVTLGCLLSSLRVKIINLWPLRVYTITKSDIFSCLNLVSFGIA